ncbi:outer membrane beta-barrel protein [bacterium]|nr:outer membrane beta-barrel protein [bacterium]
MKKSAFLFTILFCAWALAQEKPNIAILDLDGSGISKEDLKGLTNRFQTEIFRTDQFTVLERAKIDALLEEQQFQSTGCTDLACAIEIGRMLNVELVVVGNVDRVGSIYSVNVRLVDVLTGKIIKNEIDDCPQCTLDQVFLNALKAAAYKIAGLEPPPKPVEERRQIGQQPPVEQPSQPVVQSRPKSKSRFKFGYFVGLNASASVDVESAEYQVKHAGSLEIGMTYDVPLSRTLFLKPEFVYQNRKAEINNYDFYDDDYSDILHYIHMPVLLSWHFSSFNQFFIGPSFGFFMRGTYTLNGVEDDYEEGEVNKTLMRLLFGTELSLGPFRLGYRFSKDLGRESDTDSMKISRNIQVLTLGFMFGR